MWRSLVAYTPGGRGVAGSNPVIPTKKSRAICSAFSFFPYVKSFIICDTLPHPKRRSGFQFHATAQRVMAAAP